MKNYKAKNGPSKKRTRAPIPVCDVCGEQAVTNRIRPKKNAQGRYIGDYYKVFRTLEEGVKTLCKEHYWECEFDLATRQRAFDRRRIRNDVKAAKVAVKH